MLKAWCGANSSGFIESVFSPLYFEDDAPAHLIYERYRDAAYVSKIVFTYPPSHRLAYVSFRSVPARAAARKKDGASRSKLQNTADADGRFVASNSTEGWGVVPDQHLKLGLVNNKRLLDVKGYLRHSIKQPKLYGT